MKHLRITSLVLIIGLMFCFVACSDKGDEITIDAEGIATWEAVENAMYYEVQTIDEDGNATGTMIADDNSFYVPEGYNIKVRAIFEDETTGKWMSSSARASYVDKNFNVSWKSLKSCDIVSNIKSGSVKILDDGSVYFEVSTSGGVIRFNGTNVTVGESGITFEPDGQIVALDSIGSIYAVDVGVSDPGSAANWVNFRGGYTFTDATSVDSPDELFLMGGMGIATIDSPAGEKSPITSAEFQSNFVAVTASETNEDSFTVSSLTVYYNEKVKSTALRSAYLYADFYGTYMEGDCYDSSREHYNSYDVLDFYLLLLPDVAGENEKFDPDPVVDDISIRSVWGIDESLYTIGDLKDADGNVLDKETDALTSGCTIEVTVAGNTVDVALPVIECWKNVQTLHELTPYNNAVAEGEITSLVVPVYWQDQPETATDKTLNKIYAELGRVVDKNGNVQDYSDNLKNSYSVSEYFDTASYNNYSVTSFVTDWYKAPFDYANDREYAAVASDDAFKYELYNWLLETYPDMDWTKFDTDADGFIDSVIIINAGTSDSPELNMTSYSYALFVSTGYTGEGAGTQEQPVMKNFISMNTSFLGSNALIHEYSHSFGIIDYYDVTYSGIDTLGSFDMQSQNVGDWNAYSKYAAGWIKPEVVAGLESGESKQITIGSFAETGDAIVIPAAGVEHDGPFGEYILIDLFTDDGVNKYDAAEYGLSGKYGVRITHVSSDMEKRVLKGDDGVKYPIGTVHYDNSYSEDGKYLIEVIQAGGKNTFTNLENLRTQLSSKDLFKKGDVFDVAEYTEFFNDGLMDDGSDFGYTVEIVSVSEDSAVISITRK